MKKVKNRIYLSKIVGDDKLFANKVALANFLGVTRQRVSQFKPRRPLPQKHAETILKTFPQAESL